MAGGLLKRLGNFFSRKTGEEKGDTYANPNPEKFLYENFDASGKKKTFTHDDASTEEGEQEWFNKVDKSERVKAHVHKEKIPHKNVGQVLSEFLNVGGQGGNYGGHSEGRHMHRAARQLTVTHDHTRHAHKGEKPWYQARAEAAGVTKLLGKSDLNFLDRGAKPETSEQKKLNEMYDQEGLPKHETHKRMMTSKDEAEWFAAAEDEPKREWKVTEKLPAVDRTYRYGDGVPEDVARVVAGLRSEVHAKEVAEKKATRERVGAKLDEHLKQVKETTTAKATEKLKPSEAALSKFEALIKRKREGTKRVVESAAQEDNEQSMGGEGRRAA